MSLTIGTGLSTTRVVLPKLLLRKLDGGLSKWRSFWDSLESVLRRNSDLKEVDKFNYLMSMLEHSATGVTAGLSLTAANYDQDIGILNKRVGSKQVIINR